MEPVRAGGRTCEHHGPAITALAGRCRNDLRLHGDTEHLLDRLDDSGTRWLPIHVRAMRSDRI
jgi:hypothetical protein